MDLSTILATKETFKMFKPVVKTLFLNLMSLRAVAGIPGP